LEEEQMMSNRYDAIVIGAGIHGAGCAQALAAAGHSCLVLDQAAGPAAATSSRSSKLIHGGLRYLESRQLNLVRECLRERTLLLRNAPALVKLVPFYLPVYKHSSRSAAKIKLGLHLYHLIAGDAPGNEYNSLPESEWEDLNGLNTDGLQRVYQYFDAQTDDKALTKAVLRSARGLGAKAAYDARVEQIELLEEGVRVNYLQQTTPASVEATVVINAAGPM
jgi:glycerol-3-phosphate dehydrogenase